MVIYLDQNKWIELARIVHGRDESARARRILQSFTAATESKAATIPLSAIHYMETARISNLGRKQRLASVMWRFSQGVTAAAYQVVVKHELEISLNRPGF